MIVGFRTDVGGFTDVGGRYDRSMSYAFTPTRPFVIGEKLHIRLENSCTAFAYECIVS